MAKAQYILCIDQGTTGTTSLIMNTKGQLVASHDQDFRQIFPKPGWVEHDPNDIWKSVEVTVRGAIRKARIKPTEIAAIGITNQRETGLIWDRKTSRHLHNALVWQDRRTADRCAELKAKALEKTISQKTGLLLDPYFSATKWQWVFENKPKLRERAEKGEIAIGTIDSFLVWKLSGGEQHITDVSNASRTLLMDLKAWEWDQDLLRTFDIPHSALPKITASAGLLARTQGLKFLPDGIVISGVIGDQQSALFGQSCFEEGQAKCTFGTGSFLLLNTGKKPVFSKKGLLTTVAWRLPGDDCVYALEGGAFICGAAVQFLRDQLGFMKKSGEIEKLAKTVKDAAGVEFVPALTGLGAPHWDPHARGMISGLTRGTTPAHIARATLEAMALQNVDILSAMQAEGIALKSVNVDGGASANDMLMQLQADYLGVDVVRPKVLETTSLGAGFMAGLGAGVFESMAQIRRAWKLERKFSPKLGSEVRSRRLSAWQKAVERCLS